MTTITPRCHNKPFREMTTPELREELAYWEDQLFGKQGWGASLSAASDFIREIKQILVARGEPK